MPGAAERNPRTTADLGVTPGFSRRQFLKRLGIVTGAAFMAALSLISACRRAVTTTNPVTSTYTNTNAVPSTQSSPTQASSTAPLPSSSEPGGTTANTSSTTIPAFSYVVPTEPPPLVPVPDTTCTVATDRLYSLNHVWVKLVSPGVVVLGITSPMVKALGEPHAMTLPDFGLRLAKDDPVCAIEGYKIATDIFTPVGGVIVQVNENLRDWLRGGNIQPIEYHPYTHGWIIAVRLSKTHELDELMDAQKYLAYLSKSKI